MTDARKRQAKEDSPGGAEECERQIARIYGASLDVPVRVIHVASVWRDSDGRYWTLRIGEAAPRSELDQFVLGLARARSDAIVTTGRILRAEGGLHHEFAASPELRRALGEWRERHFPGRPRPFSVVLSSGRDLPLTHPVLAADARQSRPTRVFTTTQAAARLAAETREIAEGAAAGFQLVGRPEPSLRDCLACLAAEGACASVEAGPSSAQALYAEPGMIDELLLSVFCETELAEGARGPEFVSPERLQAYFSSPAPTSRFESQEESGRWSFLRFTRG